MQTGSPTLIGRYAIYDRIAAGGMATVHLGRLVGEAGFSRTVAIKRLHPHFAMDPDFVSMFLDEARLAARIRHPNVVQTLDVVVADGEVFLVMDYVEGESLAHLMRILAVRRESVPTPCASALLIPVLHGLHAAHEARNDHGEPLGLVHRDVSPQNVLVGIDGVPRVLDFGVAKALGQSHSTREGQLKGKIAYMAPEQIEGGEIDRRTDVFAAAVVLWEALAGRRLFKGEGEAQVMRMVLNEPILPPSTVVPGIPPRVDQVVMCALSRDAAGRFPTTEQMADALEEAAPPLASRKLAAWVQTLLGDKLSARANLVREIESASTGGRPSSPEGARRSAPQAQHPPIDAMDVTIAVDAPMPRSAASSSQISRPLPPLAQTASGVSSVSSVSSVSGVSGVSGVSAVSAGGASQASSISVEAPRRATFPPRSSSLLPMLVGGALALCIGSLALVIAFRRLNAQGTVAAGEAVPPAIAVATAPPPPPPVAPAPTEPAIAAQAAIPTTYEIPANAVPATAQATATATPPAPVAVSPAPTVAAAATSSPTQNARPSSASRPSSAGHAASPAPAASSKLYSRF